MNRNESFQSWSATGWWQRLGALGLVLVAALTVRAESLRTQTIQLQQGWNAIHLQVAPTNSSPAAVFANTPVIIAAAFYGGDSAVQFIQNPGDIAWKKDGWAVWYAPARPDAFLATLFAINGNQTYLIFAEQAFTWNVTGAVALAKLKWKPDSYNFAGFGVDVTAPPAFGRYFAASPAHQPGKIYRLVNGQWTLLANLNNTAMRAGEACWVFCKGASDFQGPLTVKLASGDGVSFGTSAESPITLANRTADPLNVKVETIATDAGVPLAAVVRGVSAGLIADRTFDLPAQYTPPALEGGQSTSLWLKLRRERMTGPTQTALLKISTDAGTETWVPVTGTVAP